MQATLDNRQYETFNSSSHTVSRENHNGSSFNSPNPFSSRSSAFGAVPMRAMNPIVAPRTLIQPAVYPQMSRNTAPSYNPYGYSAPLAGQGSSRMPPGSITNYSREVVRTPDGGKISKISFTQVRPPVNQYNPLPDPNRCDTNRRDPNHCDTNRRDPNRCDTNRRGYDDRCWENKSNRAPHEDMNVTAQGDDLKVKMGNNTTLETKKSDSDLFLNTQVGNDKISISSTGDPHFKATVNGKEVLKGDYKDDLGININGTKYLMSPEVSKTNNGPAPYLSSTYVQQRDGSMYKLDHLSQTDKTSKPTYSEITDAREKAAAKAKMDSAHTLTYDNNGGFVDSETHKKATNEDINKH